MNLRKYFTVVLSLLACGIFAGSAEVKADEKIIDMGDFYEGDLVVDGFELKAQTRLSIHAIGAEMKNSHDMFAYGWIIYAATRETVWVLDDEDTKRHRKSRSIREFEGEITLPAGKYEVFYYAGKPYSFGNFDVEIENFDDAMKLLGTIFDSDDEDLMEYYSEHYDELRFTIEAPDGSFEKYNPVAENRKNVIVDFAQPGDDFFRKKGFTLTKEMTLNIIAIGEFPPNDRVFVDYGWIISADSRKKVWTMDKWNTSWAGGGRKNRGFNDQVKLPAGNYIASFYTDDSHSFGEWNVLPPYDPLHYGMIISVSNENDLKNVGEFEDDFSESVIVQINRIRNDQYKSKGFSIKEKTNLHILAIGEFGYQGDFVDYGWIEDIDDNEIVWTMDEDNTEYAGGDKKNRKFDCIVTLPAGNYMVHYISDDSHAYRSWNSSAPYEKKMWGITIYGAGKDYDTSKVTVFEEPPRSSNLLAGITGVGDDKEIKRSFILDKPQKVHIFALGEGKSGQMYDYGWIEESDKGEVIWEMTYRKTRHAGGDRKNRMVDKELYLEKGEYDVYYMTDGSHSFPEFNSSRPDNPHRWGITITKK